MTRTSRAAYSRETLRPSDPTQSRAPLLVDDYLAVLALRGRAPHLWGARVPSLPWLCHVRLIRALVHRELEGRLTRLVGDLPLRAALDPHPDLLTINEPRDFTEDVARIHGRRGVSLMTAEVLGTAIALRADLHVAEHNTNQHWRTHLERTGVQLVLYSAQELEIGHGPPVPQHREPPRL